MLCSVCKKPGHNKRTCNFSEECPICFEKLLSSDISVTKCNHRFHTSCLIKACIRNGSCPICREKLSENKLIETFISKKEKIITRTLDEFNIIDRFPKIITDEDFKLKIVEDFVYFSNLILYFSLEELTV